MMDRANAVKFECGKTGPPAHTLAFAAVCFRNDSSGMHPLGDDGSVLTPKWTDNLFGN